MRTHNLLLLLLMLMGCSNFKTRPETADKLKPILVLVNPPNGAATPLQPLNAESWQTPLPGHVVTLQFHFIGPESLNDLTLTPAEPEPRPLTVPIVAWTVASPSHHNYPGLRHVTIEAQAAVPGAQELTDLWPPFATEGFVRLRYTFIISDGTLELPLAGDFVVYRDVSIAGAAEHLFGSTIVFPEVDSLVSEKKLTIVSTLNNRQNEPVKIGWYVSAGEIKNRRAATTEWELPGAGNYTLIFTVRGKESRNGDIQIRQVAMP